MPCMGKQVRTLFHDRHRLTIIKFRCLGFLDLHENSDFHYFSFGGKKHVYIQFFKLPPSVSKFEILVLVNSYKTSTSSKQLDSNNCVNHHRSVSFTFLFTGTGPYAIVNSK